MPPQGTKENLSPEKASMLKKNYEDNFSTSDQLEQCIAKQAKTTKIFSFLHALNLVLTLSLLGCSVYFLRDINQQLAPTELEAQRQISSFDGESESCCKDVDLKSNKSLEQKVAEMESRLSNLTRTLDVKLRDIDQASEPLPGPVHQAPVVHRGAQPLGGVAFEEPKTKVELPVLVEGSGGGIDLSLEDDYIFVDDYDNDPDNDPVEVLNPGDEVENGSGSGDPHQHGHHHNHEVRNPNCIEGFKPVCPNDCYDQVTSSSGCKTTVCCHHKK